MQHSLQAILGDRLECPHHSAGCEIFGLDALGNGNRVAPGEVLGDE